VTGAQARTDRSSLETPVSTPTEAASPTKRGSATRQPSPEPPEARGQAKPALGSYAITSRTNRHSEGENPQGKTRYSPCALQRRRQEALERYVAGEPIEVICREMGCSKSWLYKWKNRYEGTEPEWVEERSRRPQSTPTKTPDALEAEIVRLRQTLSSGGLGPVSADGIREPLRQHGGDSIPSRRTIYRILKRQTKEVTAHDFPS
jgi:transposase